jgi:hypothetical protein
LTYVWLGIQAPTGAPADRISKLPAITQALAKQRIPVTHSPAEMEALTAPPADRTTLAASEQNRYRKIVQLSGVRSDRIYLLVHKMDEHSALRAAVRGSIC